MASGLSDAPHAACGFARLLSVRARQRPALDRGDASVPEALLEGFDGLADLVPHVGGTTRYPLPGGVELHVAAA